MSNTNVSSNDFRDYSLDSWDHCNVLLLALSTFHHSGVMEENKFIWNDAEGIYRNISVGSGYRKCYRRI